MRLGILSVCGTGLLLLACSKKHSSSSSFSDYPAVATLANQALPSSLQSSAAFANNQLLVDDFEPFVDNSATHITAFTSMFSQTYPAISGTSAKGYINSLLNDMDYRFAELAKRFSTEPTCAARTAETYAVDLSGVVTGAPAALKLNLDVQCRDLFDTTSASEKAGTGSGLLFGKTGSDYSIMLVLNEKGVAESGFGYAAKVTHKDQSDETVDMIFGEARPASGSTSGQRQVISRVVAKRKQGIYEMMLASTSPSSTNAATATVSSNMGCGMRGLTNGTLVYVTGEYVASGNCTGTNNVQLCLTASTLAASAGGVADCAALKASMSLGTFSTLEAIDSDEVTNADSSAIFTGIQINNATLDAKTAAVK